MTCLVEIGSSGGRLMAAYPLTVAVLAGTSKTGTPTCLLPGPGDGGFTSALSAAAARPSTSPGLMAGSGGPASCAERTCPACGETKPLDAEHFYPSAQYRGGFRPQCIPCVRYVQQLRRLEGGDKRHSGSAVTRPAFPALPARALAAAIDRCAGRSELTASERDVLRKWRNSSTASAKFDVADGMLQRLGLLWFDVWRPCPGDAAHYAAVAGSGECPACEAFCLAEDAFTSADGPVGDLSDLEMT